MTGLSPCLSRPTLSTSSLSLLDIVVHRQVVPSPALGSPNVNGSTEAEACCFTSAFAAHSGMEAFNEEEAC